MRTYVSGKLISVPRDGGGGPLSSTLGPGFAAIWSEVMLGTGGDSELAKSPLDRC